MNERYSQADVDAIVAEFRKANRQLIDCDDCRVIAHSPDGRAVLRFERRGTDVYLSVPADKLAAMLCEVVLEGLETLGEQLQAVMREAAEPDDFEPSSSPLEMADLEVVQGDDGPELRDRL